MNQTIHDGKRVFFGRVTSFIVDKTKINRTLKKLKTDLVLVLFDPGDLPRLRSVDFTTLLAVGFNCSDSSTFRTVARTGPPSLSRRVPLIANQLTKKKIQSGALCSRTITRQLSTYCRLFVFCCNL